MIDFAKQPWLHPAVSGKHIVRHTRDYAAGAAWNVATCLGCGWTHRETVEATADRWRAAETNGTDPRDDAAYAHWREIIAKAEALPA
jgi:hypothetical protein